MIYLYVTLVLIDQKITPKKYTLKVEEKKNPSMNDVKKNYLFYLLELKLTFFLLQDQ